MKTKFTLAFVLCIFLLSAQENPAPLPKHLTKEEQIIMDLGLYYPPLTQNRGITNPPDFPTRTIGEWEELQSIVVTWDAYYSVLREIVRYAKEEVEVINICQDSSAVKTYLSTNGIDFGNLTFIQAPFNTVWVRDYGPNPVYQNDVDSLVLIDWIYNRPRPADDIIPDVIGDYLDVPVYSTTEAPYDLVHTGGNFMADGLGTGFSSQLILEENDSSNTFGTSNHSEDDIEDLMSTFMGIQAYPKMGSLPYDGINHIDMHMKLLDEQTLLIGEFPEGVSDGPQIEANIQFVLNNYRTYWGKDFKIERIIQPPCGNGNYPPNCQGGGFSAEYRTYTNALFVNKTILVPIYDTNMDDAALERWRELMPGYKVHGINCRQIINAGGAIHCVTKEIGVKDPLWISHGALDDLTAAENLSDYPVEAIIKHRSGIASAELFWTMDTTQNYQSIPMNLANANEDMWIASIPQQENGGQVFYYIKATANSGKSIVRPLPAPEGYFDFTVEALSTGTEDLEKQTTRLDRIYPNPANSITVLEIESDLIEDIKLSITDIFGQEINTVFSGQTRIGKNQYFINVEKFPSGIYMVRLESQSGAQMHKLVVR